MKKFSDFSTILPVCHGGLFLRKALRSFRNMEYPSDQFELIIAGSDNDIESRDVVTNEAHSVEYDISYIPCASSNRSAMLNAACAAAQGRILVFADDDCLFMPDWLKKIKDVFEREADAGIVGGRDVSVNENGSFSIALDYVLNSFVGTGGLRKGSGPRFGKYYPKLWNMAVPYEVAEKAAFSSEKSPLRFFNESLSIHEDVDLAVRIEQLGRRIIFAPEVEVGHYRDTDYRSFVKRNFIMARIARKLHVHPLPHLFLLIFVLIMTGISAASIFLEPLRVITLLIAGIYIAILLASAVNGFARTKSLSVMALIPLLQSSLHVARGLGYLFSLNNSGKKEEE